MKLKFKVAEESKPFVENPAWFLRRTIGKDIDPVGTADFLYRKVVEILAVAQKDFSKPHFRVDKRGTNQNEAQVNIIALDKIGLFWWYGVEEHPIPADGQGLSKEAMTFDWEGEQVFAVSVDHPGYQGRGTEYLEKMDRVWNTILRKKGLL